MARLLLKFCAFVCYSLEKVVKIFQVLIHFIFILKVEGQLQIITLVLPGLCPVFSSFFLASRFFLVSPGPG